MNELKRKLIKDFQDKEYAHSYMQAHAVSRIAAQVHALRKQRGLSQEQLSSIAGIAQEKISKIESADFESLTMKTLQKLAKAFDVDIRIAFVSFSDGIEDIFKLNNEDLQVTSREEDLGLFTKRIRKVETPALRGDFFNEVLILQSHNPNLTFVTSEDGPQRVATGTPVARTFGITIAPNSNKTINVESNKEFPQRTMQIDLRKKLRVPCHG